MPRSCSTAWRATVAADRDAGCDPCAQPGTMGNVATNPNRDPIDEEIERMLAANPGLLEELQEHDRRAVRGEDVGEFVATDELRRRLGLPPRQRPA